MRQYGMLQAIYMSFYSKKLYRDVAMNWGGHAFLFLLLVVAVSWIPATYQLQSALNHFYAKTSDVIVAQIPVLTITKGKLSTPEKRPYIIKQPDSKEIFAVIDTTGKFKNLQEANAEILITETEMITKPKPETTRIDQFPTTVSTVIDPVQVNQYAKNYLGFSWVFLFPLMVVFAFIYRVILAMLCAVVGTIFSMIAGVNISFGQTILVAMVALAPVILIGTVLSLLDITIVYETLLFLILTLFYLFYGVLANKR